MKYRIAVTALWVILCSCATVNYMGETFPPTQYVDLYFSENDIEKDYKVIGRIIATADADELLYSSEKFTQEILKKAGEKGADGVVILEFGQVMTGISESKDHTVTKEQKDDRTVRHESERTSSSVDEKRRVEALAIKYKSE